MLYCHCRLFCTKSILPNFTKIYNRNPSVVVNIACRLIEADACNLTFLLLRKDVKSFFVLTIHIWWKNVFCFASNTYETAAVYRCHKIYISRQDIFRHNWIQRGCFCIAENGCGMRDTETQALFTALINVYLFHSRTICQARRHFSAPNLLLWNT